MSHEAGIPDNHPLAITTEVSASSIVKVINHLNIEDSGKFYSYDGTVVPW